MARTAIYKILTADQTNAKSVRVPCLNDTILSLYTTYLFITEVEYINTRDAYSQPLECRKCIKIKIQSYQS